MCCAVIEVADKSERFIEVLGAFIDVPVMFTLQGMLNEEAVAVVRVFVLIVAQPVIL
jgi:hypothetical protein